MLERRRHSEYGSLSESGSLCVRNRKQSCEVEDGRLADVAPTILKIMGLEAPLI